MATPNKALEQPARGSNVGVWDVPVNGNMTIIDNSFGATTTVALINTPVTLSPSQYQCAFLRFTGTITANVAITLPALGSFYTVLNQTTNSSAFVVTMLTTAAGSQQIGVPAGEVTEIYTDGSNVRFRALPHVGTYWDFAGSSVPLWVTACTVPPWLNCNATTFSSVTYPRLAALLGGTTLPDSRGRFRAALNQTTGRITSGSSTGGVDGNTIFASGGVQTVTLSSQNVPPVPWTETTHTHTISVQGPGGVGGAPGSPVAIAGSSNTSAANSGLTSIGNTTPTNFGVIPPTYIGGITMIRAG